MNAFMPSEIARLVLGYLKESSCFNTLRDFLDECPHLCEYRECLRNGLQYPTDIGGKNLKTILNEYYLLKLASAENKNPNQPNHTIDKSHITPRNDVEINTFQNSTQYLNDKSPHISNDDHFNQSFRRKNSPTKKNIHLNSTPKSSMAPITEEENNEENETAEALDISVLLEQLMNSRALHEKIAENINKAVNTSTQPSTSGSEDNQLSMEKELTIKEIVNQTESDPVFEEFLTTFFDNLKNDSSLDVTQTQIEDIDALAKSQHCNTPLNVIQSPSGAQTGSIVEQIPTPSSVVEITSSEVEKISEKQVEVADESGVDEFVPSSEQTVTNAEQKSPFCFPTSSNHLILKTPHKNQPCLQLITISPGEIDWPTLSNLVLASPYGDILNNVDGRNVNSNCDSVTKTITQSSTTTNTTTTISSTAASPSQFLKTKNRVDCHVIRDLNFGEPTAIEQTKEINRSPVLNTLVNSAKQIVQTDKNQKGPHIRVLEFKSAGTKNSSQKIDKPMSEGQQSSNNGKRRKPLNMHRKLKRPRRENRRGLTDMDVETFLNNLCYVE
uniref:LisH domain-containing protein n=1 Tax=Strigamia maritima TaxID=126957 RepID=T1JDK1_STRMM